jgi:hypothetical protein
MSKPAGDATAEGGGDNGGSVGPGWLGGLLACGAEQPTATTTSAMKPVRMLITH